MGVQVDAADCHKLTKAFDHEGKVAEATEHISLYSTSIVMVMTNMLR